MSLSKFPKLAGHYLTPLASLPVISAQYGRRIRMKRDDLCSWAPGGGKVHKPTYLPADAQAKGCGTILTTGGAAALFATDLPHN